MIGNFTFWEILLIVVAILLLFGAKRIPEIAGSMGKGIREFKRSLTDVDRAIREPERDQRIDPPRQDKAEVPREAARDEPQEPKRLLQ